MKKIVIILSAFALIAVACGQVTQKHVVLNKNSEDTLTKINNTNLIDLNKNQLFNKEKEKTEKGIFGLSRDDLPMFISLIALCFTALTYILNYRKYKKECDKKDEELYNNYLIKLISFKENIYRLFYSLKIKKIDDIIFLNIQNDISNLEQVNEYLNTNVDILTELDIFHTKIDALQKYIEETIQLLNNITEDDLERKNDIVLKYSNIVAQYQLLYYYLDSLLQIQPPLPKSYTRTDKRYKNNVFLGYYRNFTSDIIAKKLRIEYLQKEKYRLENEIKKEKEKKENFDFILDEKTNQWVDNMYGNLGIKLSNLEEKEFEVSSKTDEIKQSYFDKLIKYYEIKLNKINEELKQY